MVPCDAAGQIFTAVPLPKALELPPSWLLLMEDQLSQHARRRFGLTYLYPYQRLVITSILESAIDCRKAAEDPPPAGQIVVLPTGAGKSLCFQLPQTLLRGYTLVVYPLLGLMNDQERRIRAAGFSVAQLRGGQDRRTRFTVFQGLRTGALDFLLTNPETLAGSAVRRALRPMPPARAVIDEAHCVSEWGDSFRGAYLTLGESLTAIGVDLRVAFTATASDHVITRIREVVFGGREVRLVRGDPDRPNINYSVVPSLSVPHSLRSLVVRPKDSPAEETPSVWHPGCVLPRPAVVFCRTRAQTEAVARLLTPLLPPQSALYYHAGLAREQKLAVEEQFFHHPAAILAATCAYGMGVDKADIRSVVHTYLPATAEAFLQESGRAGRDRAPALSIVLLSPREQIKHRRAVEQGTTNPVQAMAFGNQCRREQLLHHFGVEEHGCGGCDVCDRRGRGDLESWRSNAAAALVIAVASERKRLSRADWVALLRGRPSYRLHRSGATHNPVAGRFADWTAEELRIAFDDLCELGLLIKRRDGLSLPRKVEEDKTDPLLPFRFPRTMLD